MQRRKTKEKNACSQRNPVRRPAGESNECEGRIEELLTREKSRRKVRKKKGEAEGCVHVYPSLLIFLTTAYSEEFVRFCAQPNP